MMGFLFYETDSVSLKYRNGSKFTSFSEAIFKLLAIEGRIAIMSTSTSIFLPSAFIPQLLIPCRDELT